MNKKTDPLTPSDDESKIHSEKAKAYIADVIASSTSNRITFAEYMQQALYAPGIGYYSAGSQKFGRDGDFVTAPEISPLFSYCIARQCAQVLEIIPNGVILEFGAGTGIMASDILIYLEKIEALPETYFILEVSAELKKRQHETLSKKTPHLLSRVVWLNKLPEAPIKGVILANEVLDAMPVHRFHLSGKNIQEYYVRYDSQENKFDWELAEPSSESLRDEISKIQKEYLSDIKKYSSEISLIYQPWINSLSDILDEGVALLIDYGYFQHEYYHSERNLGTLMCHFRHHSHDNPLILSGIQDMTAHVDFTAVAEYAMEAGFDIAGYTQQANFLLNSGLIDLLSEMERDDIDEVARVQRNQQIKQLTMPTEMGEIFKVLGLSRKIKEPLIGFGDN